jgi:hypothetical protein
MKTSCIDTEAKNRNCPQPRFNLSGMCPVRTGNSPPPDFLGNRMKQIMLHRKKPF